MSTPEPRSDRWRKAHADATDARVALDASRHSYLSRRAELDAAAGGDAVELADDLAAAHQVWVLALNVWIRAEADLDSVLIAEHR